MFLPPMVVPSENSVCEVDYLCNLSLRCHWIESTPFQHTGDIYSG